MPLRLAVLAALLGSLGLIWALVHGGARYRGWRRVNHLHDPALSQGQPTILFFTGERCSVCQYRQKPALAELSDGLNGSLRVLEMDAAKEAGMARRFGVLSLPTTVVLAPDGTVGAVNYGFAPRDQLEAQVRNLGA